MNHAMIKLTTMLAFSAIPLLAQCQSNPTRPGPAPAKFSDRRPSDEIITRVPTFLSRRIEGLWDEQVEQVDCRTGAALHPIGRGSNLFMPGGALVATNNAPPTVMGVTLGQWWYGRDGSFHAKMRLNLFQPPLETFLGIREMQRDISLSGHDSTLTGSVLVQDYFPDGSPNGNPFCASETGTRVAIP